MLRLGFRMSVALKGGGLQAGETDTYVLAGMSASVIGRLNVNFTKNFSVFGAVTLHHLHTFKQNTVDSTDPTNLKYGQESNKEFTSLAFTFGIGYRILGGGKRK